MRAQVVAPHGARIRTVARALSPYLARLDDVLPPAECQRKKADTDDRTLGAAASPAPCYVGIDVAKPWRILPCGPVAPSGALPTPRRTRRPSPSRSALWLPS